MLFIYYNNVSCLFWFMLFSRWCWCLSLALLLRWWCTEIEDWNGIGLFTTSKYKYSHIKYLSRQLSKLIVLLLSNLYIFSFVTFYHAMSVQSFMTCHFCCVVVVLSKSALFWAVSDLLHLFIPIFTCGLEYLAGFLLYNIMSMENEYQN